MFARLFPILRLIRFLRLCKGLIPKIIVFLDTHMDVHLRLSYDVGKGFVTGEEEILKILAHIVDNKNIYNKMKVKIEDDRLAVSKKLGIIQKDYPEIAVNVKTRQAIRTILNKLQEAVKELKDGGLLDDFEHAKCIHIVESNINYLNTLQKIESCPPHVLLQEVPWVAGINHLEDFFFENTMPINFNQGEVIIAHGAIPEAVYIILYGVVKLIYVPSEPTLKNLETYGALPNVDYFTTLHFNERQEEFILPGNVIGELGILTGRKYDATASCETSVQAYEISLSAMLEAMHMSPDASTGLKARIWKAVALRVAHVILTNTPHYQSWTQEDIKYHLERAFVPTLPQTSILTVTELIEDILLIEGQVMDANSRSIYYAPCYIPRTIQKLIFPRNSLLNVNTVIETKLLIIPVKHCDEVDVLEDGKGLRITSSFSSRCLQHSIKGGSTKATPQRTWKMSFGRSWGNPRTRSMQFLLSSRSSSKPQASKIYGVYSSSIILSENSEKIQNIIDSSSWGSLSNRKERSSVLYPDKSETKFRQVKFESDGKLYQKSQISLEQHPIMQELRQMGSNDLTFISTEETLAIHSMNSNSMGSSDSSEARRGPEETDRQIVMPFKRVFMPNIVEGEEDEPSH